MVLLRVSKCESGNNSRQPEAVMKLALSKRLKISKYIKQGMVCMCIKSEVRAVIVTSNVCVCCFYCIIYEGKYIAECAKSERSNNTVTFING